MQNHGNLQAHAHRAHRAALCNAHRYAPATFAAIETDDGDEGLRGEMQTGKMTPVQCGGDIVAVEPGSAKFFKRGLRAPADGHTGVLQNLDRKSTRLNSSHGYISYAVFCLKKKNTFSGRSEGCPSITP